MKVQGTLEYVKLSELCAGQGQNSKVWLANEPQLGGSVAVKEIPESKLGNDPTK